MKHISDIKNKNKKDIIRLLYKEHNLSKKRIAIKLGLSPSVITKLCTELIHEGVLIEADTIKTQRAGRNEVLIAINADYKYCIGIVMNHKTTEILLTDMNLNINGQVTLVTNLNPKKHLDNLIDSLCKLIEEFQLSKDQILGIGISIKGNTDGINAYYGIWDYKVNISDYLQDRLHIPVALDNGIRCSALLEQLYTAENDFIFIKYMEPGIGGALIQDGQIKHGETHSILDFGHMIVQPDGNYCPICKRQGCLENLISFERIIAFANEVFSSSITPILWNLCRGQVENITIQKIIEAAEAGCIEMNRLFKKNAEYFAMCLINIYAALDIKKVIIIGDLFSSDRFLAYFKSAIYNYQLTPLYENIDIHKHENVLLSAVILVINRFMF